MMPKHTKTPSFSNIDMTTAGSIVTKSPNEAINKWKIPHYYKKNASVSSSSSTNTPLDINIDQQQISTSNINCGLSTPDLSHSNKSSNGKFMKSPSFKNLTSPKKMIMHDHDKKQSRSKKNGKNGMVFVNYTIQDDPDKINTDDNLISPNNFIQHDLPHEISQELFNSPNLITSLPQSKQVNSKQKSARKRMLRIFGSSKNKFANMNGLMKDDKDNSLDTSIDGNNTISHIPTTTRKSVSKPTPLNRSISTPSLNKEEMVMPSNTSSTSSQSRKKSYGSLLKYGKPRNSAASFNNVSVMEDVSFDDMMNEIVPKSNNDNGNVTTVPVSKNRKGNKTPKTNRVASISSTSSTKQKRQQQSQSTYSNLSSTYLNDPHMNTNVASMPMFDANMDASKAMEMAITEQQKLIDFNFQNNNNNVPINNTNINHSTPSLNSTNNVNHLNRMYTSSSSAIHLPINNSGNTNNISPNTNIVGLGISPSSNSPNVKNEENDASIVFSKIVTKKKRASTMDSIPSSRNSISNVNNMIKPINSNNGNKDINSGLSSMNNIYSSSIRTVSPARQRSSTRGSSNYRLSRDISSLSSVPDAPENLFLDSHQYNQKVSMTNCNGNVVPTNNGNTRAGHRKKQESISEVYRQQQQIMNNNVGTPSSGSVPFITPPYFSSNLAIPSSTSTSSTPSVGDLSAGGAVHGNGMNLSQGIYMNTNNSSFLEGNGSMDNSQNNAMIEMSDIQTPLESVPGVDIVTSTTTPTTQGTPSNLLIKNTKEKKFIRNSNIDHENMPYLPNDTSTSSSSAMESVMTNSLSTTTSHTLNMVPANPTNMVYQTTTGEPFTLVNTGMASNDINLNHFNNGKVTGMQRPINMNGNSNNGNNMSDDQLIQQMYMEFDFENPNGFLNDHQRVVSATHPDMVTESPTMTSIAGAASSTSPSTIVPQNGNTSTMTHSQLQNEFSNSLMNNNYNNYNNNNNNNSSSILMMNGDEMMSTFNSTMASGSEITDFNNEASVVDVNNEMATAFFLDN